MGLCSVLGLGFVVSGQIQSIVFTACILKTEQKRVIVSSSDSTVAFKPKH